MEDLVPNHFSKIYLISIILSFKENLTEGTYIDNILWVKSTVIKVYTWSFRIDPYFYIIKINYFSQLY